MSVLEMTRGCPVSLKGSSWPASQAPQLRKGGEDKTLVKICRGKVERLVGLFSW